MTFSSSVSDLWASPLPMFTLLLYPCPVKSRFSNHYFIFAFPCSGDGNTKPSNKSRPNKWSRVNISVPLNPRYSVRMAQVNTALTMALLHAMETTHGALMTMWSGGHMMTCHDHVVSSVSYYKSCNEQQTNVKSSNHVNHSPSLHTVIT